MTTQVKAMPASRNSFGARLGQLMRVPATIKLCMFWMACVIVIALSAQWIAPYDYLQQSPLTRFAPPFELPGHLMGTDYLGRDLLSGVLVATQTTFVIALVGSFISAFIGMTLGFIAAHFGGWVDNLIMGLADAMNSVPFMIITLGVVAFLGSTPVLFVGLMGVFLWWRYARLTRGLVLSANQDGYAEAARIVGVPNFRVYLRHILPNVAGPLVVMFTVNFPEIILLESGLSFLGVGIQPPATSLGLMVADGRNYVAIAWWLAAVPGLMIVLTTLAMSLLGDYLRDRFDARMR